MQAAAAPIRTPQIRALDASCWSGKGPSWSADCGVEAAVVVAALGLDQREPTNGTEAEGGLSPETAWPTAPLRMLSTTRVLDAADHTALAVAAAETRAS